MARSLGKPSRTASAASRNQHEHIANLNALGFTEYEAKAYLILLKNNPATAYEIGKLGALTKANVYPALESLARKGAVQPVSEGPTRYVPVHPKVLFKQISTSMGSLCSELVRGLTDLKSAGGMEYVWMISGEEPIHAKVAEMIRSARKHVWIKAPDALLARHIDELREAAKRGVEILIIFFGGQAAAARYEFHSKCKVYLHEGSGVMVGIGERQLIISTDFVNAMTANYGDDSHAAFTRSRAVVYMADSLIRHEVYLAEIFSKHGKEITRHFGEALFSLRERYLPADLVEELRARLTSK